MNTLIRFLIDLLAQAALRDMLLFEDGPYGIFSRLRKQLDGRSLETLRGNAYEALLCPLCFAFYATLLITVLRRLRMQSVVEALAASYLAGHMSRDEYGIAKLLQ